MSTVNYFVVESNVWLYLDKLGGEVDESTRQVVVKLLLEEFAKLDGRREQVELAERSLARGRLRLEEQRRRFEACADDRAVEPGARSMLRSLEQVQSLLEQHCRRWREGAPGLQLPRA